MSHGHLLALASEGVVMSATPGRFASEVGRRRIAAEGRSTEKIPKTLHDLAESNGAAIGVKEVELLSVQRHPNKPAMKVALSQGAVAKPLLKGSLDVNGVKVTLSPLQSMGSEALAVAQWQGDEKAVTEAMLDACLRKHILAFNQARCEEIIAKHSKDLCNARGPRRNLTTLSSELILFIQWPELQAFSRRQVVAPAKHIAWQALQQDVVKKGKGLVEHTMASASMAASIFVVSWLLDVEQKPRLGEVATVVKVSEGSVQARLALQYVSVPHFSVPVASACSDNGAWEVCCAALWRPVLVDRLETAAFAMADEPEAKRARTEGMDALSFISDICGTLKRLKRTGWVMRKIPLPESDSDHMHRCAMCAMLLTQPADQRDDYTASGMEKFHPEKVDKVRLLRMAVSHDLCEALAGDITPYCNPTLVASKHEKEKEAMQAIRKVVGDPLGHELFELWAEYEELKTVEAIYCKDIDKFEMVVQALGIN
eukprot:s101_g11.t2